MRFPNNITFAPFFSFALVLCLGILLACTEEKKSPNPEKYEADGRLMIEICQKFSGEADAKRLHTAAVATQTARVISCNDFFGECVAYGRCVSKAIAVAADGQISEAERSELKANLDELKSLFGEGLAKARRPK